MKTRKIISALSILLFFSGILIFTSFAKKEVTPSLPNIISKEFNGHSLRREKVISENTFYTRYYVTYKSEGYKISGIMNVPKGKGPFPVLILNHGYISTKYYTNGRGLKREQDYLAKNGYVVIHPDYRNHAGSDKDPDNAMNLRMGYVEDVINAVYAVKNSKYDFVDKENIGMLGHSLGGGIALNVMVTKPGLVKAYVLFAPIHADYRYNYERWIRKGAPEIAQNIEYKFGVPGELRNIYKSPAENKEFWDNISAINFLQNVADPVMVHHGAGDKSVPVEWSNDLEKAFYKNNKPIIYYTYENEPHEFINAWPLVMKRTLQFFDGYLK